MNKKERELLLNKQRNRLKRYSWEKAAAQLSNIYKYLFPVL